MNYTHLAKKGSALLLTLIIATTIMLVVLGISRSIIPHLEQNRMLTDSAIANYAAKAGIEYFKKNAEYFLQHDNYEYNLNNSSNTCSGRADRCFNINVEDVPGPGNPNKFNVAIVSLDASQPTVNQGLFLTMNRLFKHANSTIGDAIVNSNYKFVNPYPKDSNDKDDDCPYWLKDLVYLLNTGQIFDYNLLYIVNSTARMQGSGNSGELDFAPYLIPKAQGGQYNNTLGDYLIHGGHIFIDNAYGAQVNFPSSNDLATWYPNTNLDKIGFSWNNASTGDYGPKNTSDPPQWLNEGDPSSAFDGRENIFKYVYTYAHHAHISAKLAFTDIIDRSLKDSANKQIDNFPSLSSSGHDHPRIVGDGYTEMAPFGSSDDDKANIAMQYFGGPTGAWGWIVLASSSPATSVTYQGQGTMIDKCDKSANEASFSTAPYMFIFSIAEFSRSLKTVIITGKYGGIQRKYQVKTFKQCTHLGCIVKFIWQEIY